ncbi:MAG TPA: polysaccharide deacetylase family protein [Tepidisphaeraceae bacterium]|jgi:peptidoglycan/xylan/chitin deacetylase (PgdA/CDA1 family)|nr:polysaccharide deacetylase family protein [Tepidisphaeraceae bacterium]
MILGPEQILAIGGVLSAGVVTHGTFIPQSRLFGPVIARGRADGPARVALTFDDGPTAGATDRVLDTLGELGVKGAFFVVGRNVEREPRLTERMAAEGHLVGNHSYDHFRMGMFGLGRFWDEQIVRTDAAIEGATGLRPVLFRPPMGQKTPFIMAAAARGGHAVVTWNRGALDGMTTTPQRILERVVPRSRAGDIILLHDGVEPHSRRNPAASVAAVKPLIAALRDRGLEPVRLDALTGLRPYRDAPERSGTASLPPRT